jgi:hypothetical protein
MAKTFGKKTILINSAYRSNQGNSSTTDFIYTFPETVRNVVHTNLLTAVVENGVYNIVAGVNDQFQMGFINYNTASVNAVFASPGTQTLPITIVGQTLTFSGTTNSGTFLPGSTVNVCDGNNGPLAQGIVITASPTLLRIGLISLSAGGSVITGFLINQLSPASVSASSPTNNTWNTVGQTRAFSLAGAGASFAVSATNNIIVVNTDNNIIVGTGSVVSSAGVNLTLQIATIIPGSGLVSNWAIYQVVASPVASTTIKPITIPAKYYDLETLVATIQDKINQSIPTVWDLPPPLTETSFIVRLDGGGYLYIINNDTGNWNIQFTQPGGQELLGFAPLLVSPPATIPIISPNQTNSPFEVISISPMNIYNYDLLLIQSDRLGNSITSAQGFDCWWVIPNANSQNNSTTITYENTRHPLLETAWRVPRDFEYIDIRLLDKYGKVVDIGTNNIQLVVECFTDDDARR